MIELTKEAYAVLNEIIKNEKIRIIGNKSLKTLVIKKILFFVVVLVNYLKQI